MLILGYDVVLDANWALFFATITLVIITGFYLRETRKIRLERVRPSLGAEPRNPDPNGNFIWLNIVNKGGLAKSLEIDCIYGKYSKKFYSPSLSTGGIITLMDLPIEDAKKESGKIEIKVSYRDEYNNKHKDDLSIDFKTLNTQERTFCYQTNYYFEIYGQLFDIKYKLEKIASELGKI